MNDEISKAARDAVEAADNSEQLKLIAAVLQAQQLINAQQVATPANGVAKPEFDTKKWLVIGGVVVSVGLVGALFAVAIAIGATCATACLLILRSLWSDVQKGRR
ncbi:hypothetical protein ACF090_13145 [Streptomyces sp. NPDC014892]|uniref:hypothetical protein n=1 Tax=Streptomyces sp. NPDC014892 TaxID=3364930 RepID=UPI0036F90109